MYSVRVLADSINPRDIRLTALELIYPRIIHSEFMTHRVFSRNAASNRAIPVTKLLSVVRSEPFIPLSWPTNQKGMVGGENLTGLQAELAEKEWLFARDDAAYHASILTNLGVHKSIPNRLIEPFQWITVICSSTEWANFFNLRIAPDAEQHIRKIAELMVKAIATSKPQVLKPGEWHLPMLSGIDKTGWGNDEFGPVKVSAGKVGRVSYLTHDGIPDYKADAKLCDRFIAEGHWSPLEHPAMCMDSRKWYGNFRGWKQYRKFFLSENRGKYHYSGLAETGA